MRVFAVFDIDRPGAALAWEDTDLPSPLWTAENRENGHAHSAWCLEAPVLLGQHDRQTPMRYLCAVESAMRERLGADPAYGGLITKNPAHGHWRTLWGPEHRYTLAELAEYLPGLEKHIPRKPELVGLGRNVDTFDWLRQRVLGRYASVHHPHPIGFTVLSLNLAQKVFQRRVVAGRCRAAPRRPEGNPQASPPAQSPPARNRDACTRLYTVAPLARVRWGRFKISAGQVIQQHIKARVKQHCANAGAEMRTSSPCAPTTCPGNDTACCYCTSPKSSPNKSPSALRSYHCRCNRHSLPRVEQLVAHQRLQYIHPSCPLTTGRQTRRPKLIQTQLLPQSARQPASTPLARLPQLHDH